VKVGKIWVRGRYEPKMFGKKEGDGSHLDKERSPHGFYYDQAGDEKIISRFHQRI
jgi:hypothetical protein